MNKPKLYFITGTDTGIGKTYVTLKLMKHAKQKGKQVIGLKPIATGSKKTNVGLRNEDALKLQKESSITLPYSEINPFAFQAPIAPHIAAMNSKTTLRVDEIHDQLSKALSYPVDEIYIEGIGGWLVPLNSDEMLSDLVHAIKAHVIFVVGIKLGCLNHALLTANELKRSNFSVLGWVANLIEPAATCIEENIEYLLKKIPWPLINIVQ